MTTGIDVNKTRLDDMDRVVLRDSLSEPFEPKTIVNAGSGESSLSVALGTLGHRIYNYDQRPLEDFFLMQQAVGYRQQFRQVSLEEAKPHLFPASIDMIVSQRVLHYLRHDEAKQFLKMVCDRLEDEGMLYVSLSGTESPMGTGYDKTVPLQERWQPLEGSIRETFNAYEPLCLYAEDEARELIAGINGIRIEHAWISAFGNHKIIGRKTV